MERTLERTWSRLAAGRSVPIEEIDGASDALALFDAMEASVGGPMAQPATVEPGPASQDLNSVELGGAAPFTTEALDRAPALRLDTSGSPAQELSVSAISMTELHPLGRPVGGPRPAVAFDANRPVFRRRMSPLVHSVDESIRAERDQRRRESVLAGGLVYLLLAAAIAPPTGALLPSAAIVGALVGIASCELGGGVRVWMPASLVGAATMIPFVGGPALVALAAALAFGGMLVGLLLGRT